MAASLHTVTAYCPVDFLLTVISALVSCKTTTCDFKGKTDVVPQGERERERGRERETESLPLNRQLGIHQGSPQSPALPLSTMAVLTTK